jgi:tellurite resistance protein TehA-like permease
MDGLQWIPSGKRLHNYGKSPFLMGKLTISMAIFNSYVKLPEGNPNVNWMIWGDGNLQGCSKPL